MGSNGHHFYSGQRRKIRRQVLARHGLVCWICKHSIANASSATMDHVKPVKFGGEYTVENLRPAHKDCNEWRGHGPPPPFRNDDPPRHASDGNGDAGRTEEPK